MYSTDVHSANMPASTRSPDYKWIILLMSVLSTIFYTILSIEKMTYAFSPSTSRSSKVELSFTENKKSNHTMLNDQRFEDDIVKIDPNGDESSSASYFRHSDIIYGHIHMAKTGGTNLNGFLANNYERVCGNKGYSYDAYQRNERFIKDYVPHQIKKGKHQHYGSVKEIGFEDCDYISYENGHKFWSYFSNFHNMTMELHLPCRDPIDHLMSECNHRREKMERGFECRQNMTDNELEQEMEKCYIFLNRFDDKLKNYENINLKCYNFQHQFTGYIDYISTKLQPRRLVSEYVKRETNLPRVKEEECIWKDKELQQRVREHLVEHIPYYRFCDQCIGSEDDITKGLV